MRHLESKTRMKPIIQEPETMVAKTEPMPRRMLRTAWRKEERALRLFLMKI